MSTRPASPPAAASGGVAAIGHRLEVAGFALTGVLVKAVQTPDDAAAAWAALPPSTAVVILGPDAAVALRQQRVDAPDVLTVVLPT